MKENFPSAVIQEMHKNLFEYVLPFADNRLSQIFGKMEKNREYLNLKDYSVSQTTLDQVFVNFAKQQSDETFVDIEDQRISQMRAEPTVVKTEPSEVKFEHMKTAHATDKYQKKKAKNRVDQFKKQAVEHPQQLDKNNNNLAHASKVAMEDEEAIYDINIQDLDNLKEMYQKSIEPAKDKGNLTRAYLL